ncbi:MAG: DUF2516 family protein [Streptosporangiaceae bacterium]
MLWTVYSGFGLVFWGIAILAFLLEAAAFIDAIRRPAEAFPAAGKQTKKLWLLILGFASVFGAAGAAGVLNIIGSGSIFLIAAFIAGVIYTADVKPAVKAIGGGRGSSGPYGPW